MQRELYWKNRPLLIYKNKTPAQAFTLASRLVKFKKMWFGLNSLKTLFTAFVKQSEYERRSVRVFGTYIPRYAIACCKLCFTN